MEGERKMRRYISFIILLTGLFIFLFGGDESFAKTYDVEDRHIQVSKDLLGPSENDTDVLTDLIPENRTFTGLVDEAHYYYNIPVQGAKEGSEIQLNLTASPLLLPDSTFTVLIDDQPVKSISLDSKGDNYTLTIPLEGDFLSEGFHEVTLSFYGNISEDICTNDENPASWITINSSSFLTLDGVTSLPKKNVLKYYPYPFIQPEQEEPVKGAIVVPNEATTHTLLSATKIASYLSRQLSDQHVPILFEDDLETIDTHLIAVGPADEWEAVIADFVNSLSIDEVDEGLLIDNFFIESAHTKKQLMFVTAEDDETLANYVHVLADDSLVDQLDGNQLLIEDEPKLKQEETKEMYTFKQLDIPDQTITGKNKLSQVYFYQLPNNVNTTEDAHLNLKMNFSKTLLKEGKRKEITEKNRDGELVVYVNDVPHSIAVDQLEKAEDAEFYDVNIPIDGQFLKDNQSITLQFAGNGLRDHDICVLPNDDHWIFIHEDSSIQFSLTEKSSANNFAEWPNPFLGDQYADTAVVLPDIPSKKFMKQTSHFLQLLSYYDDINRIELYEEADLTHELLREKHLIFLGHFTQYTILDDVQDDLLIDQRPDNLWNVSAYHFLQETSDHVAWIQSSPWQSQKTLAVFSSVEADDEQFTVEDLLLFLDSQDDSPTIVVENKNGDIFTYDPELDETADGSLIDFESSDAENQAPAFVLISFLIIFAVAIILLIFMFLRRRKRK